MGDYLDISANGFIGIGLEVLPPPVLSSATPNGSGGTLAAGARRYAITALTAYGESTISNEVSATTTGSTSIVTLAWVSQPDATGGFNIYATAIAGGAGTELKIGHVASGSTGFVDDGSVSPSGAFPKVNLAGSPGTYADPTKYFPITSESLTSPQSTNWRRPIRQSADVIGAVAGEHHITGDIVMEALEDVVVYFLSIGRYSLVRSGSSPNFVYTFTPTSKALTERTMSVTVVRNGEVFGYVGCRLAGLKFSVDNGLLSFTATILGLDEAEEDLPTPTFTDTDPYGLGDYTIEIPTASAVCDTDKYEFSVDDGGKAEPRLCGSGSGAKIIYMGERATKLTLTRDFLTRDDYDDFRALTAAGMRLLASKDSNNSIDIVAGAVIKDTYQVNLSGQGDPIRAQIDYQMTLDPATGRSHQIIVKTQENMI